MNGRARNLVATCVLALPACFASTGLENDPCPPDPCATGVEVESCAGRRECTNVDWCGITVACDYGDPPPRPVPPVPPTCTDPRPVCADSVEVESCDGWDTCLPFEWCGATYYCASNITCDAIPPSCPPGEEFSETPCAPGEVGCRDISSCGEFFACRAPDCFDPIFEPCLDATSAVIGIGEGQCPDSDSDQPCYETNYCGGQYYCLTTCPQGGEEVDDPSQCRDHNDCYRIGDTGAWCQGNGPTCRAVPVCEGGMEIEPGDGCDLDSVCEYVNVCSTTIYCQYPLDIPG